MSLTPADQRALHEIESRLSRSDSALAAMFTLLDADTRKPPGRQGPSRRGPSRSPAGRARKIRLLMFPLLAVIAALLVVGITLAVTAATDASWSGNGHGAGPAYSSGLLFPGTLRSALFSASARLYRSVVWLCHSRDRY